MIIKKILNRLYSSHKFSKEIDSVKILLGNIISENNKKKKESNISSYEFSIFSQWGDDGIIDYLINNLDIKNKSFIEFGVQDYTECNTKFLLMNKNWKGLIIDEAENLINKIKNSDIYWRFDLTAIKSFITKNNINNIFKENNFVGQVGLLSIDIDGNDYWIWDSINCVDPEIVIIEYNSRLGFEKAITIPYREDFERKKAHYSNIYYGASLKALINLGKKKNYIFIGCNSAGNNAYFIKSNLENSKIKEIKIEQGFVHSKFRESRDENGNKNYLAFEEEKKILKNLNFQSLD
jgi:hypothetical protein